MKLKQALQICIDTLKSRKPPLFPLETIESEIAELERVQAWCYPELEMGDIQKVTRCKNCLYYKRYKKKDAYKPAVKYLCSLDKVERRPEFYCASAINKED